MGRGGEYKIEGSIKVQIEKGAELLWIPRSDSGSSFINTSPYILLVDKASLLSKFILAWGQKVKLIEYIISPLSPVKLLLMKNFSFQLSNIAFLKESLNHVQDIRRFCASLGPFLLLESKRI